MSKSEMRLTPRPMDKLFCKQNVEGEPVRLQIDQLVPYSNHPFHLYQGERLEKMIESIKHNGIITPIIVRPRVDGSYEILAGHNRVNAAKLAGLHEAPAFINDIDDDTAALIVVETNLSQRSTTDMLPSEKAKAYKMQLDVIKKQGKRNDLLGDSYATELHRTTSRDKIGNENNLSGEMIRRYIRLNYLTEQFLQLVDEDKISVIVGATLSFLPVEHQDAIYSLISGKEKVLKPDIAKELRRLSDDGEWNIPKVRDTIFPPQSRETTRYIKIKVDVSTLNLNFELNEKQLMQEFLQYLKDKQAVNSNEKG